MLSKAVIDTTEVCGDPIYDEEEKDELRERAEYLAQLVSLITHASQQQLTLYLGLYLSLLERLRIK